MSRPLAVIAVQHRGSRSRALIRLRVELIYCLLKNERSPKCYDNIRGHTGPVQGNVQIGRTDAVAIRRHHSKLRERCFPGTDIILKHGFKKHQVCPTVTERIQFDLCRKNK